MGRDDRRYLHQVRRALRGTGKQKKQVLAQVQASVSEYREENPDCSYSDLVQRFGVPQQIAEAAVSEMGTGEVLNAIEIKRPILRIVTITAGIILTLWLALFIKSYIEHMKNVEGFATVEIVEVVRDVK